MRTVRMDDEKIITFLEVGSWILLFLMTIAGCLLVSGRFALGVLAGGLLAIINFYWLRGILRRALLLPMENAGRFTKVRYILRLAIMAIIVWFLIVRMKIDLIGLLAGLSVLVLNIFAMTIYRMLAKEVS